MTTLFALKYVSFLFFEGQWFLILIKCERFSRRIFFVLPSANLVINLNFFLPFSLYRFNYGTVTSLIIKKWGEKIFEP